MPGNNFSGANSFGIKGLDFSLYSVVRLSAHSSTSTNFWGRTQGNIYTGCFRVLNVSQSYSSQGVFVCVMLHSNPGVSGSLGVEQVSTVQSCFKTF